MGVGGAVDYCAEAIKLYHKAKTNEELAVVADDLTNVLEALLKIVGQCNNDGAMKPQVNCRRRLNKWDNI